MIWVEIEIEKKALKVFDYEKRYEKIIEKEKNRLIRINND